MIKNIVLDIGNVLIPFSWRHHLDSFGFSDEVKERLAEAVFLNDDWNEIDRGVLTKEEFFVLSLSDHQAGRCNLSKIV